jgi:predicted Zn-dependent protease
MNRALLPGLTAALALALGTAAATDSESVRSRAHEHYTTAEDLQADLRAEIRVGREVAARILGRYSLVDDEALVRYVNLVGQGVALHGSRPELDYRFAILDTNAINAYAAPGGYVFVTRGALQEMQDEAELAGVLAHEIAHVNQRHIVRALDIKGSAQDASAGLARIIGAAGDPGRIAFKQAVDQAVDILFSQGLERADELEADRLGTLLAARTGYDPAALPRFLDRVAEAKGERLEVIHRTHPPFNARVQALDELIASEGLDTLPARTVQDRFEQTMDVN